jgi:tRNA (guanosine-2'-O-)-methyltransferase
MDQYISDTKNKQALLNYLLKFITDKRNTLFDKVLSNRTRHITVVLEDIYQSQNASAVLRSCDITGIQDVHIIENNYEYAVNPDVALGSFKWLNLIKYSEHNTNTIAAFNKLRSEGYRIVATTPHKNDQTLEDIPLDKKVALVFGTELTGLSETAIENADEFLSIPMFGFTESFNISVSAALILYNLTNKLRNSAIEWHLTEEEKLEIKIEWAKRTIDRSDVIVRHFLKSYNS